MRFKSVGKENGTDVKQWKDRSADGPISAKKPRKVKERQKEEMKKREEGKTSGQEEVSQEEGSE